MAETKPKPMLVEVINYRGETALRRIMPTGEPYFGTHEPYHPKPGWLLPARDVDRGVDRVYAMESIFPIHPTGLARLQIINDLERCLQDMIEGAGLAEDSLRRADNLSRADKLRTLIHRAKMTLDALGQEPLASARVATLNAAEGANTKG